MLDKEVTQEGYLNAYVEGRIQPAGFRHSSRKYVELPVEKFTKYDGLVTVVSMLEKIRK